MNNASQESFDFHVSGEHTFEQYMRIKAEQLGSMQEKKIARKGNKL